MNKKIKYEAVIGLEIHAELKTKSKMFCSCANSTTRNDAELDNIAERRGKDWQPKEPNIDICPVCLGMPGTLPVINKQAVEWTVLTGLALNCKINKFTKWDRKNYFYPDLPKGYQISQYDLPICYEGQLEINSKFETRNSKQIQNSNDKNSKRRIGITRIHLEEDTGTLKHPEGRAEVDYSLADYNRAGVPLMELVTEPDLRTAKEAKEFCQKYQQILRTLKVSDANMEKGEMRCEANVSIRKIRNPKSEIRNKSELSNVQNSKQKLGTKVEVKNLNSFKSVEKAIEYEIKRQEEALESGEKIIQQTRGWDEKNQKTYVMRTKETSADYRYFPEPDIPPVELVERGTTRNGVQSRNDAEKNIINIDEIRKQLPELPQERIKRYVEEYKIKQEDAQIIADNLEMAKYFEEISNFQFPISNYKTIANWIVNEVSDLSIKPKYLVELVNLIEEGKISGKNAKEILPEIKAGKSPNTIIKEKGLGQISDSSELEKIIDKIMKNNPDAVAKIKSGKMGVMGFLVGQIMKETKGQANPKIVNELLRKKIL